MPGVMITFKVLVLSSTLIAFLNPTIFELYESSYICILFIFLYLSLFSTGSILSSVLIILLSSTPSILDVRYAIKILLTLCSPRSLVLTNSLFW